MDSFFFDDLFLFNLQFDSWIQVEFMAGTKVQVPPCSGHTVESVHKAGVHNNNLIILGGINDSGFVKCQMYVFRIYPKPTIQDVKSRASNKLRPNYNLKLPLD